MIVSVDIHKNCIPTNRTNNDQQVNKVNTILMSEGETK